MWHNVKGGEWINKVYYDWKHARGSVNIFHTRFLSDWSMLSLKWNSGKEFLTGIEKLCLHQWLLTFMSRYQFAKWNSASIRVKLEGEIINDIKFYLALKIETEELKNFKDIKRALFVKRFKTVIMGRWGRREVKKFC